LRFAIKALSSSGLAQVANPRTYCVCFFGGDPVSQMPHSFAAGKALADQGVVICWEKAGTMHPRLMQRALDLSIEGVAASNSI
jgi:pyruvate formate lyase activating enzyme